MKDEHEWVRAGTRDEIASRAVRSVEIAGRFHVGLYVWRDKVYALDDLCPHWGAPLSDGCVLDDGRVECALHSWSFDLETGVGREPWMGAVTPCRVREENGEVYVALPVSAGEP